MKLLKSVALLGLACVASSVSAADALTVYSYRQAFLIEPILEKFTEQSGVDVKVVFAKDGIAERMVREGRLSPADVVLTSDFSRLMELVEKDLVSPVDSAVINSNIPPQYRS
ncbi:MAG: iron(III) transport system substrate-binding protein, partial [Shewanella sp.]